MRKIILVMMAVFLAAGLTVAVYVQTFKTRDRDLLTRAEANKMVEEAVRQAEIDIRKQLDEENSVPEPEPAKEEEPKEPEVVEEPEEPKEEKPKRKFYTYEVKKGPLHYRIGPSLSADIINLVPVGTKGYILDYNEDGFSLCLVNDTVAYMYTPNMKVEEIEKSQFPKKYRKLRTGDVGRTLDSTEE